MAAERLAEAGHRVVVCERMAAPARKLLLAGRGGLNLTHSEPLEQFLGRYGTRRDSLEHAIRAFPPAELVAWAEGLGQPTFVGSSGRVFPKAMKASPLLRAWLRRLGDLGVALRLRHDWQGWDETGALRFATPAGPVTLAAGATVLALGGASWPRLGGTGDWVPRLTETGLAVAPLQPANCGLEIAWSQRLRAQFAGTPLKRIALALTDAPAEPGPRSAAPASRTVSLGSTPQRGEAVLTQQGLEGGAVYALVPAIRAALARQVPGTPVRLRLDLRPDLSIDGLAARLSRPRGKLSMSNFLRKAASLPPVAIALLHEGGAPLPAEPAALAGLIKAVPLAVTGTAGLDRAISTAGGVALAGLDAAFMANSRPGLFLAGEMLDWEAPTGGYLLQACFATGHVAGRAAARWLSDAGSA